MARRVKTAMNRNYNDALRIVRTEGQRSAVVGQQKAAENADDLGVKVRQIWDATLDGRTRPRHGDLDGRARDEERGGWWVPGIGWVSGPLQSGDPSFDINCRCRVREEIAGYEPKVRRQRDKGLQPYQTYNEWKKTHK
jgi:hypothetical protein